MRHGWALPVMLAFALAVAPRSAIAAAPNIEGVWGIAGQDGEPKCSGTAVLVFHRGVYVRVLPKHGTLSGDRVLEMGRSTYRISGDRVEVDQVLTWSAPEPRRTYLIKRGGEPELVREGSAQVVLKRCPLLDPERLIQ